MSTPSQRLADFLEKEALETYKYRTPPSLPKLQAFLNWVKKAVEEGPAKWAVHEADNLAEKVVCLEGLVNSLVDSVDGDISKDRQDCLDVLVAEVEEDPDPEGGSANEADIKTKIKAIMNGFRDRGWKVAKEVVLELEAREFENMTMRDYLDTVGRCIRAQDQDAVTIDSATPNDHLSDRFQDVYGLKPWHLLASNKDKRTWQTARITRQNLLKSVADDLKSQLSRYEKDASDLEEHPREEFNAIVYAERFLDTYVAEQQSMYPVSETIAQSQFTSTSPPRGVSTITHRLLNTRGTSLDDVQTSIEEKLDLIADTLSATSDYEELVHRSAYARFNMLDLIRMFKGYKNFVPPSVRAYESASERDGQTSVVNYTDGGSLPATADDSAM
ncbi:hypothetical protein QFC21_002547 [Naganishia friedmannii]|uniref:Uncharacterized protein n=1 Tax=Naganishia friedmannii TaxID=89922 RepID=A0ACC2VW92_9TREE|nr:hypothetical protein QFC21_002547 [Naganishia friedmannii]